jgi:hypothetical protein
LDAVIAGAVCPELVKMTAYDVSRRGPITNSAGKTSGMIGSFHTLYIQIILKISHTNM